MSEQKKVDTKALLERSRQAKSKPQSKMLEKKLGRKKNMDKFGKVNFSG
ncbi:hypothetical protein [Amedibacillus sp. YH-ame10]